MSGRPAIGEDRPGAAAGSVNTPSRAGDDASAALREALALAGAPPDRLGEHEVEALFALLEQIDRQSLRLQRALDGVMDHYQGADSTLRHQLREELTIMYSRLKRLHVAACLAHVMALAGADAARSRVETLQARFAQAERHGGSPLARFR